jgi:hypothetical protein
VVAARSGTCIDLAGLFASVAESSGLKVQVVHVPGHAFPAVKLPSGKTVYVEATGVGGGTLAKSFSFAQARAYAEANYQNWVKNGLVIVTDVSALRKDVSAPEFPAESGDPVAGFKDPSPRPVVAALKVTAVKHNVTRDGKVGLEVHLQVELDRARNQSFWAFAVLTGPDGKQVRVVKSAPFTAASDRVMREDVVIFLASADIPAPADGKERTFKLTMNVWSTVSKEGISSVKPEYSFTLRRTPDAQPAPKG